MSKPVVPKAEDFVTRAAIAINPPMSEEEQKQLIELARGYLFGERNWVPINQLSPKGKQMELALLNVLIEYLTGIKKKDKTRRLITAHAKVTKALNVYNTIMPPKSDI